MDSKRRKLLEDCVLRILHHGDMNRMTESKIRKLAGEETGLDLTDPVNRKVVKRVVENFFMKAHDDGSPKAKVHTQAASRKPSAQHPPAKPDRRRKLITLDDDDDEEEEEVFRQERKRIDVEESDDLDEIRPVRNLNVINRNPASVPGRNQSRRKAIEVDESEKSDESCESDEEEERKPVSKSLNAKRANGTEDSEEEQTVEGNTHATQKTARRRVSGLDEESDEEEEDEEWAGSSKRKTPVSGGKKQRQNVEDDEDEDEGGSRQRQLKKRPTMQTYENGDSIICQLSSTRSVAVQSFKGKTQVAIREYYEKDGMMKPTKKGINLTAEQWETFKEGIPAIEAAIKKLNR